MTEVLNGGSAGTLEGGMKYRIKDKHGKVVKQGDADRIEYYGGSDLWIGRNIVKGAPEGGIHFARHSDPLWEFEIFEEDRTDGEE
jgi:hypothetical protein